MAARAFLRAVGINRHGAVALRVATRLIGLGVAGFVEVATGGIAAGLVTLLSQVALVEVLIGSALNMLTSSLVAFVVMLVFERVY